ncbi:hypothetical protein SARC_02876 [Sphaeroforma arctica JP610]|uniref:Uncharacterized protein n=1 Tax=Sphaeroforma arctica JP610 TaxID=667725 RepID=A0A0L0G7A1_9EUKA|nr:hypothetical protein SARC_02876 [Sphaeroforma arctica JP610]KNC84922.1 hypothetical protein SARC_02876 [Sphaeroforma arctica JP610]|eukprot:XP_014158824.1 hypothetical protein SARC_02876 [Sphaeroforma arctica JP610]
MSKTVTPIYESSLVKNRSVNCGNLLHTESILNTDSARANSNTSMSPTHAMNFSKEARQGTGLVTNYAFASEINSKLQQTPTLSTLSSTNNVRSSFHPRKLKGTSHPHAGRAATSSLRKKSITEYRKNSAEFMFRTINSNNARSPELLTSIPNTEPCGSLSKKSGRAWRKRNSIADKGATPVCHGVRRKSLTSVKSSTSSDSGSESLLSLPNSSLSSSSQKSVCEEICEEDPDCDIKENDVEGEELDTVSHTLPIGAYNSKRTYSNLGGIGKSTVDRREDVLRATQPAWKCQQLRVDIDKPMGMMNASPKPQRVSKMSTLSTITSLSHLFLRRGSIASATSISSIQNKNDVSDLDFNDVIDSNIGDIGSEGRPFIPMGSLSSIFKKRDEGERTQDALQDDMEQHYTNIATAICRTASNNSSRSSLANLSPPTLPASRRHSLIRKLLHKLHLEKKIT